MDELVEQVAEVIYRHKGGIAPDEYEAVAGKKQKEWKTDAAWDTNPDELCEWERDEYRVQARAVLRVLEHRRDLKAVASRVANELEQVATGSRFVAKEAWLHFLLPLAARLRIALRAEEKHAQRSEIP